MKGRSSNLFKMMRAVGRGQIRTKTTTKIIKSIPSRCFLLNEQHSIIHLLSQFGIFLLIVSATSPTFAAILSSQQQQSSAQNKGVDNRLTLGSRIALEAEINKLLNSPDGESPQVAKDIIGKIMLDNLTEPNQLLATEDTGILENGSPEQQGTSYMDIEQQQQQQQPAQIIPSVESLENYKLRQFLEAYRNSPNEESMSWYGGSIQPSNSKEAKAKRTSADGSYKQLAINTPSSYEFGKLFGHAFGGRVGDGVIHQTNGLIQPVSQYGKRPSSHRYEFGLGKRVNSPIYPRYDFGLGKRAPSKIRYDFGLGK